MQSAAGAPTPAPGPQRQLLCSRNFNRISVLTTRTARTQGCCAMTRTQENLHQRRTQNSLLLSGDGPRGKVPSVH